MQTVGTCLHSQADRTCLACLLAQAAVVYDMAVLHLYGPTAKLNFPRAYQAKEAVTLEGEPHCHPCEPCMIV